MVYFQASAPFPALLTSVVGAGQRVTPCGLPAIRISSRIFRVSTTTPSWVLRAVKPVLFPPLRATGMTAKMMLGVEIGRRTFKGVTTIIALFRHAIFRPVPRLTEARNVVTGLATKLLLGCEKRPKFYPTLKTLDTNQTFLRPSGGQITGRRTIPCGNLAVWRVERLFTLGAYCRNAIFSFCEYTHMVNLTIRHCIVKINNKYVAICKERLNQEVMAI